MERGVPWQVWVPLWPGRVSGRWCVVEANEIIVCWHPCFRHSYTSPYPFHQGEGSKTLSPEKEETASSNYDAWTDLAFSCGEQGMLFSSGRVTDVPFDCVLLLMEVHHVQGSKSRAPVEEFADICGPFDGTLDQLVYLFSKQSGLMTTAVKFRGVDDDINFNPKDYEEGTIIIYQMRNLCRSYRSYAWAIGKLGWVNFLERGEQIEGQLLCGRRESQMRQFLGKRCAKSFNCILPNLLLFVHNTTNSSVPLHFP
ncbi:integrase-type DNA-binding superfamily protein, partial [Striga asiatica]